jgi:hypothetical protein
VAHPFRSHRKGWVAFVVVIGLAVVLALAVAFAVVLAVCGSFLFVTPHTKTKGKESAGPTPTMSFLKAKSFVMNISIPIYPIWNQ